MKKKKKIELWNVVFIVLVASALIFIISAGIQKTEAFGCYIDLDEQGKMFENVDYNICIISNCGDLNAYLDNKEIEIVDNCISINLPIGYYILKIESDETEISRDIEIFRKECELDEIKSCTIYGCDGTQRCENYEWEQCYKNTVICVPGSTAPCAITPCVAGKKTCNSCGTGYGPCVS